MGSFVFHVLTSGCYSDTVQVMLSRFLERQMDLFPLELLNARLACPRSGATSASEAAATKGRPGAECEMFHGDVSQEDLYVLVTRKGSLKNETKRLSEQSQVTE